MSKRKKLILKHIIIVVSILTLMAIYTVLGISCPFSAIFGIPCPACGMTRSIVALLCGKLGESLEYNPLTLLVLPLIMFAFHKDLLPIKKRTSNIILTLSSLLIFCIYLIRIISNT